MRVALALSLLLGAQIAAADKVDDYIRKEIARQRIPGLALGVVRDGKLVKSAGYGFADLDNDVKVTPDTVFEVASITKQFTATLIMMLVEEGKVRLDDKINAHLPNPPDKWKDITVRQLLNHTGGLAPLGNDFRSMVRLLDVPTEAMYAAAKDDALTGAPGEAFSYSDVGYFLLGMIIEKATGKKYAEALSQRILSPLGMKSSRMLDQLLPYKKLAKGYTLYRGPEVGGMPTVVNIRRVSQRGLTSHYGLFSTVGDLAKWDAALYRESPVTQASLRLMWSPTVLNDGTKIPYGFGWNIASRLGYEYVYHSGITGTMILRVPELKLSVVVLTNLGKWSSGNSTGADALMIAREVAGMVEPKFRLKPLPDADPVFTARARTAFEALAEGRTPKEVFSDEGIRILTKYMAEATASTQPLGQVRKVELLERTQDGKVQLCLYRFTCAGGVQTFTVVFDAEGKIEDFFVDG
jgi:CubicO group peptidase (beta-lactamase class C family)